MLILAPAELEAKFNEGAELNEDQQVAHAPVDAIKKWCTRVISSPHGIALRTEHRSQDHCTRVIAIHCGSRTQLKGVLRLQAKLASKGAVLQEEAKLQRELDDSKPAP